MTTEGIVPTTEEKSELESTQTEAQLPPTPNVSPEDNQQKSKPPSDIYSVRLPVTAIPIVEAAIQYHFAAKHIASPSRALYLKYLMTEDSERIQKEINKRRAAITQ